MNFQPVVPVGGLAGWVLLNKTIERQTVLFDSSPSILRDTDYFESNIQKVRTAEELVSDRRLLRVALGAFGLAEDINSRALIRKVLEDGVDRDSALANRLTDRRYRQLAETFGFAETSTPRTQRAGFGKEIAQKYRRQEFEVAVGQTNQALRLAMNAQRDLSEIGAEDVGPNTKWLRILGTPPLRRVFETALGLPQSFAQLDLDRQFETLKTRAARHLEVSDPAQLADPIIQDKLVRRFLLQDQINSFAIQSSQAIALSLLQAAPRAF
ncbi:MAG: flagellar protein [Rhodobacteraceae bacterium CG17_big_fil_post_rev_8_21_14_2_50_63_15]|nr:DUF1217 domain-containing protein [Roseovarius sp.]PIV77316.1 MAG: flagellar protein [Rhodobacteraceae bacterium CG17_big_fil_post_rev_8_21_14_2_50_63_15]